MRTTNLGASRSLLIHIFIPLAITCLALYGITHMSGDISFAAVRTDAIGYAWGTLLLAFTATLISYIFLGFYDALILPTYSEVKIPTSTLMMTGTCSLAISNLFGFSWLTGGALRFKVYTSYGVKFSAIAKLMATSWVAFFLGLIGLVGTVMLFNSGGFSRIISLPAPYVAISGLSLLLLLVGLFHWTWETPRAVGIGAVKLDLPAGRTAVTLTCVTIFDLVATALTLYVLMPPDLTQDLVYFLGIFCFAIGLGILSHSPGGLGVFDATIIAGFGASGRTDVLAAIALYRVIYTMVPAGIALLGILAAWLYVNRAIAEAGVQKIHNLISPIFPFIVAGTAITTGMIFLISGDPNPDLGRFSAIPLDLFETNHLVGSVGGLLLMSIARGLYRRMFRAWFVTLAFFTLALGVSLMKAESWGEIATLALSIGLLWNFRSEFYRSDINAIAYPNSRWVFTVGALIAALSWIGILAQVNAQISDTTWWKFAWNGEASLIFRATLVIPVLLAGISLNLLMSKQTARLRHIPIPQTVINLTHAANSASAGLSLTGDKRFIITPDEMAYLAYADTGRALICKGDPVGEKAACIAAIWQLRELADRLGRRCAFYGVSNEFLPTFLDLGLQIHKIGEVAHVNLRDFSLDGPKRKDWRYAKARIAREGYKFEVIPAGQARADFLNLKSVSDAWLNHKNSQEKGFSLGWFDTGYIDRFDLGVLRHSATGRILAFANIMKAADKSELFVDLMRYDPNGPNRVMDALFTEMMLWGRENGFATFSLGGSPLSGLAKHPLSCNWHKLGGFLYRNGESFYKFDGLRRYKQKFDPDWSPEYLVSSSMFDALYSLFDVSLLISRGAPDLRQTKVRHHEQRNGAFRPVRAITSRILFK